MTQFNWHIEDLQRLRSVSPGYINAQRRGLFNAMAPDVGHGHVPGIWSGVANHLNSQADMGIISPSSNSTNNVLPMRKESEGEA